MKPELPNLNKNLIDHPPHYTQGSIEVWDFIVDQELNYLEGNIVKYICRARHKGALIPDLHKALAYLHKLIDVEENKAVKKLVKVCSGRDPFSGQPCGRRASEEIEGQLYCATCALKLKEKKREEEKLDGSKTVMGGSVPQRENSGGRGKIRCKNSAALCPGCQRN